MGLLNWLKGLFKRKKAPEVRDLTTQTVRMHIKLEPATLKVDKQEIKEILDLLPKRKPITHPAQYGKFFKKRQPTTARKLWKRNAKIDEEDEDVNVIFREDD
jgi:hypothetical protein